MRRRKAVERHIQRFCRHITTAIIHIHVYTQISIHAKHLFIQCDTSEDAISICAVAQCTRPKLNKDFDRLIEIITFLAHRSMTK